MLDRPDNSPPALTSVQRQAIERTDQSLSLTSGAGCGKTFVLARRYLQAMEDDARADAPGRVVAVTFTDKAALEMRQRVAALLVERIAGCDEPPRRALLQEWLGRLPEARISTIHGFCSALLRAEAIEAGLDPGFSVLADAFETARRIDQACTEALLAALTEPAGDDAVAPDLRLLLSHIPYPRLPEMLAELVTERWRWRPAEYAQPRQTLIRWERLRRQFEQRAWDELGSAAVRAELDELAAVACLDETDKLVVHRAEQLTAIARLLTDPAGRTAQRFAQLHARPGNIGSAKAWGGREQVKALRQRLNALVERIGAMQVYSLPLNAHDELAARMLASLTALAADADARYAAAKRRAGLLDFVDLLCLTRDLLLRDEPLRRRTASQIRHLLIDEFQDTDSLQRELLWLAVDCLELAVPPGRLLFVGDAKQSIYRFRGAEVEVFQAAREAMPASCRLSLDLNFRTHAGGIALVNRLFAPLMGPSYEPLHAHRRALPPGACGEILLAPTSEDARADERYQAAARATAARIAEILADGQPCVWDEPAGCWRAARAGDIAILLPRLQNAAPFEEALQQAGVDYYVVAGAGLYRQQEVFDLLNALRAIDNELDDVALLGFLRGGMIALDDNALLHLARTLSPPYRPGLRDERLAERLDPDQRARLAQAADLLENLAARKDAEGIDTLIERLLAATGFEAVLLGQFHGRRKCGNVHRVLAQARAARQAGTTLRAFLEHLSTLTFEQVRAEQAAVETEQADVVRIMTIHKAKGLEFSVVFLADLNYVPTSRTGLLGLRGPLGLTLGVEQPEEDAEPSDAAGPQSHALAREIDRLRDRQEDLRAFYVAVTRHRDYIAFVAADERAEDGRYGQSGSALRMLDEALDLNAALRTGRVQLDGHAWMKVHYAINELPADRPSHSLLQTLCRHASSAQDLARLLSAAQPDDADVDAELPCLGDADTGGIERLGVTALAELEFCPACFHWHHELRVPLAEPELSRPSEDDGPPPPGRVSTLDPAAAGTLLHRCMELLDFAAPQAALDLVRQAIQEQELTCDPAPLAAELDDMLARLRDHDLWPILAGARRRLPELAFASTFGPLELSGQIDLLFQDAGGNWRIIDYKSDRVGQRDLAGHAARYELQMAVYCLAAVRFLGQFVDASPPPFVPATLYFLRPGLAYDMPPAVVTPDAAAARIARLGEQLRTARRTGHWPGRQDAACAACRYNRLCLPGAQ